MYLYYAFPTVVLEKGYSSAVSEVLERLLSTLLQTNYCSTKPSLYTI
jgi:hypothetical protein